ncbi:DNA ligase [Cohnella caldifontis]|uniref:ATP-dependent DNA ligase n=1 Tax=Cohnella caldifontis TaxID=3027471 RepID=UPI0023ECA3DF|nr:DNA ligase [Cohnella sp. YIM B05605]
MSPIRVDRLPEGPEWAYQLKWDGYRLIAQIENGRVRLYSKNMHPMEGKLPEIAEACARLPGSMLLDGEVVVMDPATGRPSFQKMQQRGLAQGKAGAETLAARLPASYVVFDLLQADGEDMRARPFEERNRRLREAAADWTSPLFTTDLFADVSRIWEWVVSNGWEGVVCKKLSSPYREGKEHRDWFKRKSMPEFDVEIVGVVWREGRVASLVMRENGVYFGRVSSGLNGMRKEKLRPLGAEDPMLCPFPWKRMPPEFRGTRVRWLAEPIPARVTGTEVTEEGVLRHPKLLALGI